MGPLSRYTRTFKSFTPLRAAVWPPGDAGAQRSLSPVLVQSGERRNAENLSETVPGSARGMQRFLTDSPWDDEAIIGRLQEYLAPRLEHPEGVWVLDGSDFPKQGRKSAGVARQYCGRLGKVANCQAGMFLAYVSPLGRALVDKRLYLPESWTKDPERCAEAGVPEERRGYRSKTELALETLRRALELGHLRAGWVAADDAFGRPSLREGLAALGMRYVLDVPAGFTVWPPEPAWTNGIRASPQSQAGERAAADNAGRRQFPEDAWQEITVAQGSQGPRSYQFIPTRAQARRNPLGHLPPEPGRQRTPLLPVQCSGGYAVGDPGLCVPLANRNRRRATWGWTSTRPAPGRAHHHVALCLLGGAFLLSLQQAWGEKDAPDHEAASIPGGAGDAAQGTTELLRWLEDTQNSNERASRSHAKRRAALRASQAIPP